MILSTSFLALLAVVPVLGSPSPAGAHVAFHRPKSAVATPDGSAVITQNLRDTIGQILQKNAVPGSAIALVRLGDDGGAEYGAWGNRTEDGDPVTTDVSHTLEHVIPIVHIFPYRLSSGLLLLQRHFSPRRWASSSTTLPTDVTRLLYRMG